MTIDSPLIQLVVAAGAGLLGWFVGLASAWLMDRLLAQDGVEPSPARRVVVREPLVQGGVATMWTLLVLAGGLTWQVAGAALLAVPLVQVGVTDLRYRWVYSAVAVCGLAAGVALSPAVHAASAWWGLAGAVGGLVSMGLVATLGRLAYGGEPMGRGDLTIAAMVGAAAGPEVLFDLGLGVILSGLFAAGTLVARRSRTATIPYGPGLCLGGLVSLALR